MSALLVYLLQLHLFAVHTLREVVNPHIFIVDEHLGHSSAGPCLRVGFLGAIVGWPDHFVPDIGGQTVAHTEHVGLPCIQNPVVVAAQSEQREVVVELQLVVALVLVVGVGGSSAPFHLCLLADGVVQRRVVDVDIGSYEVVAESALQPHRWQESEHQLSADGLSLVVGDADGIFPFGGQVSEQMAVGHSLAVDGALLPAFLQAGGQRGIGVEAAFGHASQEGARKLVVEHAVATDGELCPYRMASDGE